MKDFVSFEIAKKLKEKGFDWICSHYYRTTSKDLFRVFPCEDWSNTEERVNAPTISQVLKWLREKKDHHICIGYDGVYSYDIVRITDCEFKGADDGYASYESAALSCIEYVIDNLI